MRFEQASSVRCLFIKPPWQSARAWLTSLRASSRWHPPKRFAAQYRHLDLLTPDRSFHVGFCARLGSGFAPHIPRCTPFVSRFRGFCARSSSSREANINMQSNKGMSQRATAIAKYFPAACCEYMKALFNEGGWRVPRTAPCTARVGRLPEGSLKGEKAVLGAE